MRSQELSRSVRAAGTRLLAVYSQLAARGEHLLGSVLGGESPRQWRHYPVEDAIDVTSGYQWFYHSHDPDDRPGAAEHGHVHLFAGRPLWAGHMRSRREAGFRALCGAPTRRPRTRHLLALGFDAKGVPVNLFTVNSWVTGDLMLSAPLTLELLHRMRLDSGHPELDAVIEAVVKLCGPELANLMARRDNALAQHSCADKLADRSLEILSEISIDLDAKLRRGR